MATLNYTLTDEPVDVVAFLGLSVGTNYQGQFQADGGAPENTRENEMLHFWVGGAAPIPANRATLVPHLGLVNIEPAANEGVYMWVGAGHGIIVVNEVP